MAHKAIDDHMEGQQPGYSNLGTNPENKEAFCEVSIHVTLYKKASQFANIHYYRNETETRQRNQLDNEVARNKDGSMPPARTAEHHAISEFLQIVQFTTEIPGRRKEVWDGLSRTMVKRKARNKKANRTFMMKEGDFDVDGFAEAMYDNVSPVGNSEGDSKGDKDVELPEAFYGNMTNDNDSDEPEEQINGTTFSQNVADRGEVEITTGRQTNIKIRRAAVNKLAFKDIVAEGRRRLEKKNLHVVRYRSFERENRKRKLDYEVYDEISKFLDGVNESMEDEIELGKLKRMKYDMLSS